MTEAEWLVCTDTTPMLEFLRGKASDRKLRLFAVGCCRRIWQRLKDERCRRVVGVAERFADGLASQEELEAALELAVIFTQDVTRREDMGPTAAAFFVTHASLDDLLRVPGAASRSAGAAETQGQCRLIWDIFGPLVFRPIAIDPSWLTSTVINLAQAIYTDRAFSRLAVLADALEDAGCTQQDILNHCRQPGDHVRGCFVIDLLLGRE